MFPLRQRLTRDKTTDNGMSMTNSTIKDLPCVDRERTGKQVVPGSEQTTPGSTQLVTGRLSVKPTPPPKPNATVKNDNTG